MKLFLKCALFILALLPVLASAENRGHITLRNNMDAGTILFSEKEIAPGDYDIYSLRRYWAETFHIKQKHDHTVTLVNERKMTVFFDGVKKGSFTSDSLRWVHYTLTFFGENGSYHALMTQSSPTKNHYLTFDF